MKSIAGKATLSLSVSLDNGPVAFGNSSLLAGNARNRRRIRRAAQRNANSFTENTSNTAVSDFSNDETKVGVKLEEKCNEHAKLKTLNPLDTEEVGGVLGDKLDEIDTQIDEDKNAHTEEVDCCKNSVSYLDAVKSKTRIMASPKEALDTSLVEPQNETGNDLV